MPIKKQPAPPEEDFNPYQVIEQLKTDNLIIKTIPDEEWILSCYLHKDLLVDVYVLTGNITGIKKTQTLQCGRLSELLLKFLFYGRSVQFHCHTDFTDENRLTHYVRARTWLAETLEEDALIRMRDGDLVFCLIPGERWRLTNTCFGQYTASPINMFYLAQEQTIGKPNQLMYKGSKLERVLLQFLCQNSTFVEKVPQSKILEFRK